MKIGIIGSGNIGGTVGTLWARAGHQVLFSSRHPDELDELVKRAGKNAAKGTPEEAARFGDVIMVSVPLKEIPGLARSLSPLLKGKIVLDTANPFLERDGALAREILDSGKGTGPFLDKWYGGARVVRAFNSVNYKLLATEAHRNPPRIGIPLASDDRQALDVAAALVRDAGFDPVLVGGLDRAKDFDVGTPVYNTGMSGPEVRKTLKLSQAA